MGPRSSRLTQFHKSRSDPTQQAEPQQCAASSKHDLVHRLPLARLLSAPEYPILLAWRIQRALMDRIEAMRVFVTAVDEGSLAGAGRRLKRSPAAVSRAIAFLEQQVGAELLHRTTRSLKLSEIGERYAAACRRVLIDIEEADMAAAGEHAAPEGTLTVTAP